MGGAGNTSGIVEEMAKKGLQRTPFTQIANPCELPALSVPLHWTPDGLPCGAHFIGPFDDEDALFRLAGQLEKARPWIAEKPLVWTG